MKTTKTFVFLLLAALLASAGCTKHDLDEIRKSTSDLEDRVTALENKVDSINNDIRAIYAIINTVTGYDHILSVTPLYNDNHVEIGYTITFSHSGPVDIYHGKDGADGPTGADGSSPSLGVEKHDDGRYYWTVNGAPLTDKDGNPVPATGEKGDTGDTGATGPSGSGPGGADGKTPKVKLDGEFYWMVSPDGRDDHYEYLLVDGEKVKAKGEDGASSIGGITVEDGYVKVTIGGDEYLLPSTQTIGVGWITYLPANGDGTAAPDADGTAYTLDFMVYPREAAEKLVTAKVQGEEGEQELWQTALSMKIRYTAPATRASATVDEVQESEWLDSFAPRALALKKVQGAEYHILSATIGADMLKEEFRSGTKAAWAALCVCDGTATVSSEFTPLARPAAYCIRVPDEDEWARSNVWHAYDENGKPVAEMSKELIRVKNTDTYYHQAVVVNPVDAAGVADLRNGYVAQVLQSSDGSADNRAGGSACYLPINEYNDTDKGGLRDTKLGNEANFGYCMLTGGKISGLRAPEGRTPYENRPYEVMDNAKDRNLYPVVRCGATYWLRENLRATYYNDGTTALADRTAATIQTVNDEGEECARIFEDKAAYVASSNSSDLKKYGYLYNFRAIAGDDDGDPYIMEDENVNFSFKSGQLAQEGVEGAEDSNKQLCPKGWHIPTCNSHNVDWPDMDYLDTGLLSWKWEYAASAEQPFLSDKKGLTFNNLSGFSLNLIPAYTQDKSDFKIMDDKAEFKDGKLQGCIPFWTSALIQATSEDKAREAGNDKNLWYPFVIPLAIVSDDFCHNPDDKKYGGIAYCEGAGAMSYPVRCVRNHVHP